MNNGSCRLLFSLPRSQLMRRSVTVIERGYSWSPVLCSCEGGRLRPAQISTPVCAKSISASFFQPADQYSDVSRFIRKQTLVDRFGSPGISPPCALQSANTRFPGHVHVLMITENLLSGPVEEVRAGRGGPMSRKPIEHRRLGIPKK